MSTVFSSATLAATTVLSLTRPGQTTGEWTCESLVIIADSEVRQDKFRQDKNYCPPSGQIGSLRIFLSSIEAIIV